VLAHLDTWPVQERLEMPHRERSARDEPAFHSLLAVAFEGLSARAVDDGDPDRAAARRLVGQELSEPRVGLEEKEQCVAQQVDLASRLREHRPSALGGYVGSVAVDVDELVGLPVRWRRGLRVWPDRALVDAQKRSRRPTAGGGRGVARRASARLYGGRL
jgi:hypothetical protein